MRDNEILNVQLFDIRVCLEVLEKAEDDLAGLLGPSALCYAEFLGLTSAAHRLVITVVRDATLVSDDCLEIVHSDQKRHVLHSAGCLVGVLEGNTDIFSFCLAG